MMMNQLGRPALLLALALALLAPAVPAQTATNDPYQALVTREFGTAADALAAIEQQIQAAAPADHPALEQRLIGVLENPAATMPGKQFACQMLRLVGSPACVPAVARLLTDEKLSHMARIAFLDLKDPAVDAALRDALKSTRGEVQIGIVHTIGDRADRGSLNAVAGLLNADDARLVAAVLNAVGKIGGAEGAAAMDGAKVSDAQKLAWAQAYLRCASGLAVRGETKAAQAMYRKLLEGAYPSEARAGALRGMVFAQKEQAVPLIVQTLGSSDRLMKRAAQAAVIAVPGHAATVAFAQQLSALPPEAQASLIGALAARGDAEGLTGLVNKLAGAEHVALRETSLRALGRLGDVSSIPLLVAALADPTNGPIATQSLVDLRGTGVVEALMKQAEGGPARIGVLNVLAERKQGEALPVARKIFSDPDAKIRQAAVKVLSELGTQEDLQSLCAVILTTSDQGERERQARAISAIGVRLADKAARDGVVLPAFGKADAATKRLLLPVLSAFGGDQALAAAVGALAGEGEDRKAAVRALAEWPDSAPLASLQKVAGEETNETVKVLALRGFIKMINPSRLKTEEKLEAFRQALALSTRPDEKRQVLPEIAKIGREDSLKIVEPFLADDALKREAAQAYEKIAESLVERQPEVARAALQKVLADTKDEGLGAKAKAALDRIK
jgi:HEAT repeat protein